MFEEINTGLKLGLPELDISAQFDALFWLGTAAPLLRSSLRWSCHLLFVFVGAQVI
jgi:hypothetical protein